MAKVFIEETTLTAIGDAIRGKTGKTELIDPANMSTEIASIEAGGGGGGYVPTESALNLTGDLDYWNYNGNWDWFVEQFADKMSAKSVSSLSRAFQTSTLTEIPFSIGLNFCDDFNKAFYYCYYLTTCPKLRGTISWTKSTTFLDMFYGCNSIQDVEDLFTPDMVAGYATVPTTSASSGVSPLRFSYCYSLRKLPSWYHMFKPNSETSTTAFSAYNGIYYNMLNYCRSLGEANNIPVWYGNSSVTVTSDLFSNTFRGNYRLASLTFETQEDGSPFVVNWKSQVVDLANSSSAVGVGIVEGSVPAVTMGTYGFAADKEVTDDTTYHALKNDPDWYTGKVEYCRYNHDSAVETINSLPDASAYLATAGGTNTIKFKGPAGSKTDGGAINTLTAEEIAVATAKGWTVTLVN